MTDLQFPNILGAINAGYDRGQQQQFNRLAGQSVADPTNTNALAQAAQIDPTAALKLQVAQQAQATAQQTATQTQQADHNAKVNGAANYMIQALQTKNPDQIQGAWSAVSPYLQQLTGKQVPAQFDPAMESAIYQAAASTGGTKQSEGAVISPGGVLVDKATGKQLYSNPANQQFQTINTGQVDANGNPIQQQVLVNPQNAQATPLTMAGGAPQSAPMQTTITPASPTNTGAAAQANALLAKGMTPDQVMQQVITANPGQKVALTIDPTTHQFVDATADATQAFNPAGDMSGAGGGGATAANPTAIAPAGAPNVSQPLGFGMSVKTPPKGSENVAAKRQADLQGFAQAGQTLSDAQKNAYMLTGKFPDALSEEPLSKEQESIASKLATYSLPISSRFIQTAANQRLISRAIEMNPDLNVGQYMQNQKLMSDLASNSPTSVGGGLAAAGTGLGHLTDLASISSKLPDHDFTLLNSAENSVLGGTKTATGQALKDWDTAKKLVAGEIAKMVKGGVASEAETHGMLDDLTPNNPNRNEAIATLGKFMIDKVQSYEDKRDKILGSQSPQTSFLNAKEQQEAQNIIGLSKNYTAPDFRPPGGMGMRSATQPTPAQAQPGPDIDALLKKYGAH